MYFIILISSFLTEIPMVTVLAIRNTDTHKRMMIIPMATYPTPGTFGDRVSDLQQRNRVCIKQIYRIVINFKIYTGK